MTSNLQDAFRALREGKFVLIFDSDGREAEIDMVIASEKVQFNSIRTLRKEAGGLICTPCPARLGRNWIFHSLLNCSQNHIPNTLFSKVGSQRPALRYQVRIQPDRQPPPYIYWHPR